ncbi:MAG: patatin-like phospholipase family protein, partial [Gemmatimonadetes bacterium]|nr:patatin-like phospholipase family protein [Gemmatimonadota bacterium]
MTDAFEGSGGADLALVLSGGGARAAYQVGVLAAIAERVPDVEFPILTGVSAGAINTIYLAAHRGSFATAIRALVKEWGRLTADRVYCVRPVNLVRSLLKWSVQTWLGRRSAPATLRGLMDMQPLARFLAGCVDLTGIEDNLASRRLRAVALSATSLTADRTVTFVHGAPDVPTWERAQRVAVRARLTLDHVLASAAIPILFPAVRLDGEFFGDGSVRQTAPLAPAIHLGAQRVLAIGIAARRGSALPARASTEYPTAAEVMGLLLHSIFLDALEADAERIERVNRLLAALPAGAPAPDGLRPVELLLVRPSRDLAALAAGHSSRLPTTMRWVYGGIGGQREGALDFLSYLLFDPAYT